MDKTQILNQFILKVKQLGLDPESSWVKLLISLATETVYLLNQLTSWKVLEAGFGSSTLLNSRLQHASDMFYNTPRGALQVIQLKGVQPIRDKVVKKLELCADVAGFYLYYAKDYSFRYANDLFYDVNLLVSQTPIQEATFQSDNFLYTLKSTSTSDIFLYLNNKPFNLVENLRDLNSTSSILQTTTTNYWTNFWNYNGFKAEDQYRLFFWEYPQEIENFDTSLIQSLPDFKGSELNCTPLKPFLPRLENLDEIFRNSLVSYKSNQLLTTKSDLEDFVRIFFTECDQLVTKITPTEIEVIYSTFSGDPISQERQDEFKQRITSAYYISQTLKYVYVKDVTPTVDLYIIINYLSQFDFNLVKSKLVDIQLQIGGVFDINLLEAQLIREIPQISSIQIISPTQVITIPYDSRIKFTDGGKVEYVPVITTV